MNKLILHHTYKLNGEAVDISYNENHGFRSDTSYDPSGLVSDSGSLRYNHTSSRVRVSNKPVWQNLRAIRVDVICFVVEPSTGPRRLNLVEGELSFAFFIHPDRTLWGTFLAPATPGASPTWHGANTISNSIAGSVKQVPYMQWVKLSYEHDGISTLRLYINDQVVAENNNLIAGVPSVQNSGVHIGHWVGDGRYTFHGRLDDVKIWKYDPETPYKQFFCRPMDSEQMLCWKQIFSAIAELIRNKKSKHELLSFLKCVREAQLKFLQDLRSAKNYEPCRERDISRAYEKLWCEGKIDGAEMAAVVNNWGTFIVEILGEQALEEYRQAVEKCWQRHKLIADRLGPLTGKLTECDPSFAGYIQLFMDFAPKAIPEQEKRGVYFQQKQLRQLKPMAYRRLDGLKKLISDSSKES